MAINIPVTYCHSGMRGAPQISQQPGALLAALRAFLITGFGSATAQSVTVDNGIATAIMGDGNSFEAYSVVQISGADDAALNGRARVSTATGSTITWACDATDGAKTGTIAIRYAAATGWSEPFTGTTEKAVFQSTDPESNGHFLRIDDSHADYARVRGYVSMTDVDTGTGPFPTPLQMPDASAQNIWGKSTGGQWHLAADSRMFLGNIDFASWVGGIPVAVVRGFGDAIALAPDGDVWATLISCGLYELGGFCQPLQNYENNGSVFCPKGMDGLGTAITTAVSPVVGSDNALSGMDAAMGDFPSSVDGQLKYSRRFVRLAANDATPRALLPAVMHVPQNKAPHILGRGERIEGHGDMAGRQLVVLETRSLRAGRNDLGVVLLDVTGPWR